MPESGTIASPQLSPLSGLTERRPRQLVAEGWFPKASRGHYLLVPAIQRLLRYCRERDQRRTVQEALALSTCEGQFLIGTQQVA